MTNIYVGNLPYSATEEEVRDLFEEYGTVDRIHLVKDHETGRPRGFGFVEMTSGGEEAIESLNESDFNGRSLTVNKARPRSPRKDREGGSRRR